MTDQRYNGWTNYETWCVNLWLDNDEGSQEYWRERAGDAYNEAESDTTFTKKEQAQLDLSAILKDDIEEGVPGAAHKNSMYTDLLNASISMVNCYEIAGHMIDAAIEAEQYAELEAEKR